MLNKVFEFLKWEEEEKNNEMGIHHANNHNNFSDMDEFIAWHARNNNNNKTDEILSDYIAS